MVEIEGHRYYSAAQAGIVLGVKRRRVNQFIPEGRLNAIKIAGRYLIREDHLQEFANEPRPMGRPEQPHEVDPRL